MDYKDYYKIPGIDKKASQDEIKESIPQAGGSVPP
jgi:DnaJ-class molecular chaperone